MTTVSRLYVPVEPGLPGLVIVVFRLMVPSGCPEGGFALIPTALRLAVLTLIVVLPLTGFVETFGRRAMAVASSPVFASPFSAARNEL